ncbi:hypothetical protein Q7200_004560, partial [Escherichia coli]|nr:hypothetical protein [Escherichia coli]ELI4145420.1 hypothetical protein [Escherichia coli]ELM8178508.1 hypothetical protein [Escherichia coli]HBA3896050.1 hypothetical protein [Escherichia coli]
SSLEIKDTKTKFHNISNLKENRSEYCIVTQAATTIFSGRYYKSILDKNDINHLLITTHLSPDFIISNENKSQTIKKYSVADI